MVNGKLRKQEFAISWQDKEYFDNMIAEAVATDTTPRRWLMRYSKLPVSRASYKRCSHLVDDFKRILKRHKEAMKGRTL